MQEVTADEAKKTSQNNRTSGKSLEENTALQGRYGEIGIPAVAAAVRYQGCAKNPAYAPVDSKWKEQAVA